MDSTRDVGRGWTEDVLAGVGRFLQLFFSKKREQMLGLSPSSVLLLDAVADLTRRGGKRLRPMVLYAGARATCARPNESSLWLAGAALEMMQTYLLIHDDWMDQDNERRGGRSVHAHFADLTENNHLGASLAVLAGDLASAFAWEVMSECLHHDPLQPELLSQFARMHQEVVMGQHQDIGKSDDVYRMYDLKTGSYTVRGPLLLGALLGGAHREQLASLEAIAYPLGIAFQIRDDLLGTFGDRAVTGKPVGNDLRRGKFTALIAEAKNLLNAEEFKGLDALIHSSRVSEANIKHWIHVLENRGVRKRLEQKVQTLAEEAEMLLEHSPFDPTGRQFLNDIIHHLTHRYR
ncbi:MAG: polyprenyl synthetase family protein [Myxococcales bacterium]|nr:polyprenyl synthetase family protein [Myxococcales bacterium]MCB9707430.1 polyprenyl synthetase family protein [Myxococcales bacterium]